MILMLVLQLHYFCMFSIYCNLFHYCQAAEISDP